MPAFKPEAIERTKEWNNRLGLGVSAGGADHAITVVGANLDYSHRLGQRWNVDTRVTFLSQRGNGISVAGPGDIYLNLQYHPSPKVSVTTGVKVPLTDGNKLDGNLPLPMDYQSSLGTFDLIMGLGLTFSRWQVILGLQQPMTDNENGFDPALYSQGSPLLEFQSTNQFKRKGDVLVRLSYPVEVKENITFTPGLLPIYHLGADEYIDMEGHRQEIPGSDGLTVNGTIHLDLQPGLRGQLQCSLGFPFLVREARPDGLTRGVVLNAAYAYPF